MKRFFYLNSLSFLLIAAFIVILVLMIPLLFLGIIGGALLKLGFGFAGIILILVATIAGSFINIPVFRIKSGPEVVRVPHGRLMDSRYRPDIPEGFMVVAVNAGGCIVPVLVSLYILFRANASLGDYSILYMSLAGILVVSVVTFFAARPEPGKGIGVPLLIPPLSALVCGLILSFGVSGAAPVIAYVSGTIGTLVGADLMNLQKIRNSGADMVSIGGAGTFDGIFLAGIIAALLA